MISEIPINYSRHFHKSCTANKVVSVASLLISITNLLLHLFIIPSDGFCLNYRQTAITLQVLKILQMLELLKEVKIFTSAFGTIKALIFKIYLGFKNYFLVSSSCNIILFIHISVKYIPIPKNHNFMV